MSTLRARHLPPQVPEAAPQPSALEQEKEPNPWQRPSVPSSTQDQPQDTLSALMPHLLQTMPGGEGMSKTLQQVSQMQAMMSQMQTGAGLAGLLPMLMGQKDSSPMQETPQMMQMLPLMMQLMQQRQAPDSPEGKDVPQGSLPQLSALLSLLQAK